MTGHIQYHDENGQLCTAYTEGSTRGMLRDTKRRMKKDGLDVIRLITYRYLRACNASTQVAVYGWQEIENVK